MRLLVTGGMGFIGKAVIESLLCQGVDSIVVLDNLLEKVHGPGAAPHDFKDKRVHFVMGDVSFRNDIEPLILSSDTILHLAAETGTGQSMYEIALYNKVNISATALMLDILTNKKHRVRKVVVASSRAVYGEGKYVCKQHGAVYPKPRTYEEMERKVFAAKCPKCGGIVQAIATTEDSMIHPTSFYGITKQVQEELVMTLCPNIGIAPVVLRYQNVYGPGQSLNNPYTGILSIFSNRIRQRKAINIFEDGKESRDFVFIDDVADVTAKAISSDKANGEAFNIGTGVAVSVLEVASSLKELLVSNIDISISGNFRLGDIRHNYADIKKAKKLLGYTPLYSFKKGLEVFFQWFKSQEVCPDGLDRAMDEMKKRGLYR